MVLTGDWTELPIQAVSGAAIRHQLLDRTLCISPRQNGGPAVPLRQLDSIYASGKYRRANLCCFPSLVNGIGRRAMNGYARWRCDEVNWNGQAPDHCCAKRRRIDALRAAMHLTTKGTRWQAQHSTTSLLDSRVYIAMRKCTSSRY